MRLTFSIATLIVVAAGGAPLAVAAPVDISKSRITIYDSTQIALHRYTVVKRLGVGDWRSAFRIRSYPDLESARQALANEAARAGADGLINVTCFDQTDRIFKPAGFFCYGNAITVKK